jgi:chemotaxis protein CheX
MGAEKLEATKLTLDDALVKRVADGVSKAFNDTFGILAKPGEHKISDNHNSKGDISGLVGMVQDKMEGTLTITFKKDTICPVLAKIYGIDFPEINDSVREGVGEITNMVYCLIKTGLNENGYSFKMAIPNVIYGQDHTVMKLHHGQTLVVPFITDFGTFFVDITLQPT